MTADKSPPSPLRVSGLQTAFGDNVIHDGLDLEVRAGEVLGIVGGSGTGKSVLLNAILGLIEPTSGSIELLGVDVTDVDKRLAIGPLIGVMFQNGALFSSLTIQQNVEAPFVEHTSLPPALIAKLARLKIALVGLDPVAASLKPAELSGGMRKRAGIARAIALDPQLLFLDEPTSGLDPIAAAEFDSLVRQLNAAMDLTVVMVTHDLDSLHACCDRIAVLADKKIVATAPIAELEQSEHPWIKEYFNGPRGRAASKEAA